MVRARREPGRLPVHVRRRAPVAQEPARQQRRRPDHGRRRRRPEPQLPRALRATTTRARRRSRSSETYRGPGAASEPETQAHAGPARPDRASSSRSTTTRTASGCCTRRAGRSARRRRTTRSTSRSSGNLDRAGDRGLPPGPRLRRPVHHQRRDDGLRARARRHARVDARARPRAARRLRVRVPGRRGAGPGGVRAQPAVRARVAKSAADPDDPVSLARHQDQAVLPRQSDDPYKDGHPGARTSRSPYSYGDPQPVQVLAKRSLGAVTLKYQINGGAHAERADDGVDRRRALRAGDDVYYHVMRGTVTGTKPGRHASRSGSRAAAQTERVVHLPGRSESANDVLVLAAEDYTGASPVADPRAALPAPTTSTRWPPNGIGADVYDVDAQRPRRAGPARRAQPLHARHLVHGRRRRHPRARAGPGQRVAARDRRDARGARLPQRGRPRALHRQVRRAAVHGAAVGTQFYDPKGEALPCDSRTRHAIRGAASRCAARLGRRLINDVLEYWLGAYMLQRSDAGTTSDRTSLRRRRHRRPVRRR